MLGVLDILLEKDEAQGTWISAPALCEAVLCSVFCRALAQAFAQAGRTEMWGEGTVKSRTFRCFPASELFSVTSKTSSCHEFLSWATVQLHSWLLFFPQPTLLCCYFNSEVCSHDTHMLSTSVTNRRSVCGLEYTKLCFDILAVCSQPYPRLCTNGRGAPATAWADPHIPLHVLLHSQSITTALILKEHKRCVYKEFFWEMEITITQKL